MSIYIETDVRLDSLDLANLEMLVMDRMKELREFRKSNESSFSTAIADEQLANYRGTLKRIRAGREQVKIISDGMRRQNRRNAVKRS